MVVEQQNISSNNWYLVYAKPRQEARALENLQRQGYACFLPMLGLEKVKSGRFQIVQEPLFPRYLFIQLGQDLYDKSWAPIRSTFGVSGLVKFGSEPARVGDELIHLLKEKSLATLQQPVALLGSGQAVHIHGGIYAGLDAVFQMHDGAGRAMVLIEIMGKLSRLTVQAAQIQKVA